MANSDVKYASRFQDLVVWQKSRSLAREVFVITKSFPREEAYSLTDQIRRSSRAVGAQIAEAWAKRRYPAHFVSKLTDADGEQKETQHWLIVAFDCGYCTRVQVEKLGSEYKEVGSMLGIMISRADEFCGETLREDPPDEEFTKDL